MKTLETERLILRSWQESDLDDFYEYASVEGIGEMAGWPHHESKEISKGILDMFIRNEDVYAIVLKEKNKVIGSVGLYNRTLDPDYKAETQREIGYVLSKDYWGKGIVPEAVQEVIKHAFEDIGVDVLWCGYYLINPQSKRVNEKCRFKFYKDGIFEASALSKTFDGKYYIMTKEDYKKEALT